MIKKNEETFSNPFLSVITTVRMMLSDFENVKIKPEDHFHGFIFLLFIVLITVVLFNLLNALAISDTNNILRDAELVDTKKRISILSSYERFFSFFKPTFTSIFPQVSKIILTPNKDNVVKVARFPSPSVNVIVTIHKTAKQLKYRNVHAFNCLLWKNKGKFLTLSSNLMKKLIERLENQNLVNEKYYKHACEMCLNIKNKIE
jgi:hypothetical protein